MILHQACSKNLVFPRTEQLSGHVPKMAGNDLNSTCKLQRTMAEVLEEFDDATPLRKSYCSRISKDEFERQISVNTENGLEELFTFLKNNPKAYSDILRKRRREEAESAGLLSYLKIRMMSLWSGREAGYEAPSEEECCSELLKMKDNMVKVFEYSQDCRGSALTPSGKRFSHRLKSKHASKIPAAPPPPPPPPPPVPQVATLEPSLERRPLCDLSSNPTVKVNQVNGDIVKQLQGSGGRKRLRRTTQERSPGGTPIEGWGRQQAGSTSNMVPLFNHLLLKKFANVRTPSPSRTKVASPGAFDSPLPEEQEN